MKKLTILSLLFVALTWPSPVARAKGGDFDDVVKAIERFYNVKHKGIPFLARAGMKTAVVAARIAGGSKRRLAEAGSVKVAYFEDQDFETKVGITGFKPSMQSLLAASWSPLVQVLSTQDLEQTYVYLREAGTKFNVLVVNIGRREASVVQVTVSPETLASLMKSPDEMGQTITTDATTNDRE